MNDLPKIGSQCWRFSENHLDRNIGETENDLLKLFFLNLINSEMVRTRTSAAAKKVEPTTRSGKIRRVEDKKEEQQTTSDVVSASKVMF